MNCEVCGTELPHGAMFCGECGHAVGARSVIRNPDSGMPVVASPFAPQPPSQQPEPPSRPHVPWQPQQQPRDTTILDSYDLGSLVRIPVLPTEEAAMRPVDPEPPLAREVRAELRTDPPAPVGDESHVVWQPERFVEPVEPPFGDELEEDLPPDLDESDPDPDPVVGARAMRSDAPQRVPDAVADPAVEDLDSAPIEEPASFPWGDRGASVFLDSDELEQTLIVPRRDTGERFVLQFSTGESVTVFGSGLLGRNPMPQPGEYFDHLVVISDPGKSVSKTHLEFGQEAGAFWVSDRFSGNGSVVREPEMPVRRLVAGKRYRIVRGARIDIGEQFLVVS